MIVQHSKFAQVQSQFVELVTHTVMSGYRSTFSVDHNVHIYRMTKKNVTYLIRSTGRHCRILPKAIDDRFMRND